MPHTNRCSRVAAMATRLVHPIRSSGRRGWRGPVSDAKGPCPIRSWPVDGGGRVRNPRRPSSRGSRVRLQLNPTRITRLPSCSRASTPSTPMRLSDRGHGHGWSTSGDRGRPPPSTPPPAQVAPPRRRANGPGQALTGGGGGVDKILCDLPGPGARPGAPPPVSRYES